jgi:hypothetical protein
MVLWTEEFHLGMVRSLQMAASKADERERMLLDYLIGREQELARLVNRYGENASSTALSTWVSAYTEQYPPEKYSPSVLDLGGKSTTEIMAALQEQHGRIINIYEHLEDFVHGAANELVSDLLHLEEQELSRISQSANRLEDI